MFQPQRFIYMILAFCAVVVVGLVLLINGRSGLRKDLSQNAPSPSSTPEELKFRRIAIFDGKTTEGVRFANYVYKSSDCLSISKTTTFFGSSLRAREEILRETEKAPVVVERGPKFDDQGQQVGERVVMEFKADGQNKELAKIIWNYRSDFHSIVGPSMRHIIEFEKSLQLPNSERISRQPDIHSIIFNPGNASTGKTEGGVAYSEQQFKTSDCETINIQTIHFGSPVLAEEEFKKQLSLATNIVEQGTKVNAAGERVGERAVAMLKAERDEPLDKTIVAWTEGSEFHSIIGPNAYVLEFEKRNQQK
jgi:hypothetical protein